MFITTLTRNGSCDHDGKILNRRHGTDAKCIWSWETRERIVMKGEYKMKNRMSI